MNKHPQQVLSKLILEYGQGILEDPRRVRGFLLDLCSTYNREINLMLAGLEEQVPQTILTNKTLPFDVLVKKLAARLYDKRGIASEFAFWTVETWEAVLKGVPVPIIQSRNVSSIPLESSSEFSHGQSPSFASFPPLVCPVTGIEFVEVKGGSFEMGDIWGDGASDERPAHRIRLSTFYLGKYPVTQNQWRTVMRTNPSRFKGAEHPVENISWADCQDFINNLNLQSDREHRLPTEAEWEYAARSGGRRELWAGCCRESDLIDFAWYNLNAEGKTHPVGLKKPNGLGLHDMCGNVWEWCQDWYANDYYKKSPRHDPKGPEYGSHRVFRGGSWMDDVRYSKTTKRGAGCIENRNFMKGIRLAFSPKTSM